MPAAPAGTHAVTRHMSTRARLDAVRPLARPARWIKEGRVRTSAASPTGESGREPDMAPPREISFEQIRERAHDLWDRNHRPKGMDVQFWLMAERELKTELAQSRDTDSAGEHGDVPSSGPSRDPE